MRYVCEMFLTAQTKHGKRLPVSFVYTTFVADFKNGVP